MASATLHFGVLKHKITPDVFGIPRLRLCVRACIASNTLAHGGDSGVLRMRTSRTSLPSSAANYEVTSSPEGEDVKANCFYVWPKSARDTK